MDTVLLYMCVTIRNSMHGVLLLPSLKKQLELIQGPLRFPCVVGYDRKDHGIVKMLLIRKLNTKLDNVMFLYIIHLVAFRPKGITQLSKD